ncbi:MAG: type II toxin-antitoxin system prevent-host-death family antitoxin [Gemmataceae bacterium]|nr:type II toxin-antitoxin system prevent-host-death family antitoxin [Gemmataceae bacterium]
MSRGGSSRISLATFRARLSECLGRVRAGGTVVVTDRGKPIARIDPVGPADDPAGHTAALAAAGLARPPAHPLGPEFLDRPPVKDPSGRVLLALLGGREEPRPAARRLTVLLPDTDPEEDPVYAVGVAWRPNNYTSIARKHRVAVPDGVETVLDLTTSDPEARDEVVVRWAPTPDDVVPRMVELAGVTAGDVVYEPGPGDGRVLMAAVRAGAATAVGVELDPAMAEEARGRVRDAGLADKIAIVDGDALRDQDYSPATVVFLYMGEEFNALLRPTLEAQLRPGARVVSHRFTFGPGWPPDRTVGVSSRDGYEDVLHLWTVKEKGAEE